MKQFTIGINDAGQRLDKFLSKSVKKLPPNLLYKYIRTKRIKINGKRCDIRQKLTEGDVISLYINDEFFEESTSPKDFLLAPSAVDVVYEDENILLINKQPGLVVHEDEGGKPDTLIHRVQRYLYEKGEYDPDHEHSFAPALCNRIDRNTGGIVIAAKNAESLRILNEKIKHRELEKRYLCLVHGKPSPPHAIVTAYLMKDQKQNRVYLSPVSKPGYKTIVTEYQVLASKKEFSLCEVNLHTGRTHQIRAHMAYLGHPLAGDGKYGKNAKDRQMGFPYQALTSYQLTFRFQEDAGLLQYLNNKTFETRSTWFQTLFEQMT